MERWARSRTCFQLRVISSPGPRQNGSWWGLGGRFLLPLPPSSHLGAHLLLQPLGCSLCSCGVSRGSFCIPESNVASRGKSAPDVAEPLLLQRHEWGQCLRSWGQQEGHVGWPGPWGQEPLEGFVTPPGSKDKGQCPLCSCCSSRRGDGVPLPLGTVTELQSGATSIVLRKPWFLGHKSLV